MAVTSAQTRATFRAAALLVAGTPLVSGCAEDDAEAAAEVPVRSVLTVAAEPVSPVRVRSYPAVLEPPELTELAFEVGGRLGPVDLRIGQDVAVGEVLATVEPVDFDLRLAQAEAALAEAEAARANAAEQAARQATLFERGVAAEVARDRAVAEAEGAAARAEQARRNVELVREGRADAELRAPFDGVVNSVEARSFGNVQPGETVATLYEDTGLQTRILVSYEVAEALSVGREVAVVPADGPDAPIPATITEIARRAPAVSSFPVVATLDLSRPDLRSGMAVEVRVALPVPEAARGIPLPLSALATHRPAELDGPPPHRAEVFVFVPSLEDPAAGSVEPRAVLITTIAGDRMLVTEGLAPAERVVTAGVPFLHPGQAVRLTEEAAAKGALALVAEADDA